MKINAINFSFTGTLKKDLGDVKALKPLALNGIEAQSKQASASRFNDEKSIKNRDEFIMSHAQRASEIAEQRAKENPNVSFDDLFQEEMLKLTEYADRMMKEDGPVHVSHTDGILKRTAKNYEPQQDEFIRDVKPTEAVDKRDLSDVVALKNAKDTIDEVVSELTPRQEYVIKERYGLEGDPKTLREIAEEYGIKPEAIHAVEVKATNRLRHPIMTRKLRSLLKTYNEK